MVLQIKIPLFILNISNVFLHTAGIVLLFSISKAARRGRVIECKQHIFLLNLSIAEFLFNFIEALRVLLFYTNIESRLIETIRHYLLIINFTAIWIQVCVALFGMTIDRLMNITLALRYPIFWNNDKSKICLLIGWCISGCIGVSVSIAYHLRSFLWEKVFFLYVYPIIDASFILLTIVTYVLIYRKYKESQIFREMATTQRQNTQEENGTRNEKCSFLNFIKSSFIVPVMLIMTFIVFIVLPDLIYLLVGVNADKEKRNSILAICWLSYAVSNNVDVIIYVLLQPNVRKHLKETLIKWFPCYR